MYVYVQYSISYLSKHIKSIIRGITKETHMLLYMYICSYSCEFNKMKVQKRKLNLDCTAYVGTKYIRTYVQGILSFKKLVTTVYTLLSCLQNRNHDSYVHKYLQI